MDKKAIKTFAIESRKKLIEEVKYQASLLGITAKGIAEPVEKAEGMEVYDIGASNPNTIYDEAIEQRKNLVKRINEKGFDNVVEEVAYTWFNRIIAIRFMEVNDYLPTRVRVLSSETEGKIEPDIVTEAPHIDLDFTQEEIEQIYKLKNDNKLDELFRLLFIKQCNKLNEILPELFEKTADYTELLLSISFTNEEGVVRQLNDNISEEDFTDQVEIIGWLYQYYNTELKDITFKQLKNRVKISKERIPAATQLFTPDWIVRYMVENSLGRLWVDGHPDSSLKKNWKYYLDETEQEPEVHIELAKIREDSKNLMPEDIKVIDPAMGSGHILVYAFDVLMQIYTSVGYSERDATESILKNNLYGLDIDDRAYQLAYFAVVMKGRSYNQRIFTKNIDPQIYSIQESNEISDELIDFIADGNKNIWKGIRYLVEIFKDSKEYGSIIDVKEIDFNSIHNNVTKIINNKYNDFKSIKNQEKTIHIFYPILKQAIILSSKYDCVITNPPYVGKQNMNPKLSSYLEKNFPNSKKDLFAVFIEKCNKMVAEENYLAMITQHAFMFLSSYEMLREKFLENTIINMIHLGARAFEEIGGEVVQTTSFILKNNFIKDYISKYSNLIKYNSQKGKENAFFDKKNIYISKQSNFEKIPGHPIAYWANNEIISVFDISEDMLNFIDTFQGIITGNNPKFLRKWYEVSLNKLSLNKKRMIDIDLDKEYWIPYNKGGEFRKWYGNHEYVINWKNGPSDKTRGRKTFEKFYLFEYVSWSYISSNTISCRYFPAGFLWDVAGSGIFDKGDYLKYLQGLISSKVSVEFLKIINPTLNYQVENIIQIPVIMDYHNKPIIDKIVTENIEIAKEDWDSFETSWNFKSHPFILKTQNNELNIDNSRIEFVYNYWNSIRNNMFNKLKINEEKLNNKFIEIYGLKNELNSEIDANEVTLIKVDKKSAVKSFISYAIGCMLGRYSLDEEGLIYAGGQWDPSKYSKFLPDDDNIIPILDTEYFEDDIVGRFLKFVKITFGEDTLEENLDYIASTLKKKENTTSRQIIRNYFLKEFYKDHCNLYSSRGAGKRPIYWQFDSGKNNGFKAIIYMHRYESDLVARVRINYLHKTQKALQTAIAQNERIIESSTSAPEKTRAVKNKNKLIKQLEETRRYDEALAHIANQKIGIDLDDGVKMNYAKFQGVEISSEGKKAKKIDLLKKI